MKTVYLQQLSQVVNDALQQKQKFLMELYEKTNTEILVKDILNSIEELVYLKRELKQEILQNTLNDTVIMKEIDDLYKNGHIISAVTTFKRRTDHSLMECKKILEERYQN